MILLRTIFLLSVGAILGLIFFGGLWFTVDRLPTSRHPIWLTLSSFWGRTLVVVCGLLLVTRGSWQNALICVIGFTVARLLVSRYLPLPRGRNANNA
jgi:F1F0 ATPase subunit 2